MKPEIKENVDYVLEQFNEGREHLLKSELPHPNKFAYSKKHLPILAVMVMLYY